MNYIYEEVKHAACYRVLTTADCDSVTVYGESGLGDKALL